MFLGAWKFLDVSRETQGGVVVSFLLAVWDWVGLLMACFTWNMGNTCNEIPRVYEAYSVARKTHLHQQVENQKEHAI